jgi:hypothetical protein
MPHGRNPARDFVYAVYRRCLTVFFTEAQRHGGNRKAVFPAAAAESRVRSISVAPRLFEKTCHAQSCEESCSAVCEQSIEFCSSISPLRLRVFA